MLKQRPIVYLALIAAVGGLLVAGVPVDRVLFVGFFVFMLMMHLGGHGHGGHARAGHDDHGKQAEPDRSTQVAQAPKEDEVAGK